MSRLSNRIRKRISDAIEGGNYPETAVTKAGLSLSSHFLWLRRGKAELERREAGGEAIEREADYLKYYLAIERAKAICEASVVEEWVSKIPKDWKAARDFLAVRYSERWGKAETLTVKAPDLLSMLQTRIDRIYGEEDDNDAATE